MTYPNFKADNLTDLVDAWEFFLQDYTYEAIALALKTFVNTSGKGFAPSIDQLISLTKKTVEVNQLSELQAWSLVRKAINNASYHSEEEYAKLPELVQRTIGNPAQLREWALTDLQSVETVVASNFQRTYRAMCVREREMATMPKEVLQALGYNASPMMLEG